MLLEKIKIKKITKFYNSKRIFITTLASVAIMIMVLYSAVLLTGCEKITGFKNDISGRFGSQKQSDAAVAVVSRFFDLLIMQDYDSAYGLVYEPPGSGKSIGDFRQEFVSVTKVVSVEINWVEVKNNIATVGIDMIDTYDGEEKIYKDILISLVKDKDESWKINFWGP